MFLSLTSAGLSDAAISANAAVIAVALLGHPLSQQFGADSIHALAAISERNPPAASQTECRFLRDAIALVEAAEIAGSADEFLAGREVSR